MPTSYASTGRWQAVSRVLATDSKLLEVAEPDVSTLAWDSGRVEGNEQRNVLCKPSNGFKSTCSYFWQVRV